MPFCKRLHLLMLSFALTMSALLILVRNPGRNGGYSGKYERCNLYLDH